MKTASDETSPDVAGSSLPSRYGFVDQGARGLCATRERMAYMSELTYAGDPADFRLALTNVSLISAVLLEARVPRVHYERSARHVAAGSDDYLLVAYRLGEARTRIAGHELAVAAPDLAVFDLACPSHTDVVPPRGGRFASHVSLLLPRARLAPLLAAPDAVGGQLIRGDAGHGYGRILYGMLLELWRQAANLDVAQITGVSDAIAGLVAGALRPAPGREQDVLHATLAAKRAAIKRYLDRQTEPADAIDLAVLCRQFGVSRASLYRMFEAEGGVVHYLRRQRLERALDLLASPAHRHRRILDIAVQHGFDTESGFNRAFRRQFGITPGSVRAEARSRVRRVG